MLRLPATFAAGCGSDGGESDDVVVGATVDETSDVECETRKTTTTTEPPGTPVEEAEGLCKAGDVGDEGHSMVFDTEGEDDLSGDTIEDVACVLLYLEIPESVVARIDGTRALDGMQSATWEGAGEEWTATWNYHPSSGMNLIIEQM